MHLNTHLTCGAVRCCPTLGNPSVAHFAKDCTSPCFVILSIWSAVQSRLLSVGQHLTPHFVRCSAVQNHCEPGNCAPDCSCRDMVDRSCRVQRSCPSRPDSPCQGVDLILCRRRSWLVPPCPAHQHAHACSVQPAGALISHEPGLPRASASWHHPRPYGLGWR